MAGVIAAFSLSVEPVWASSSTGRNAYAARSLAGSRELSISNMSLAAAALANVWPAEAGATTLPAPALVAADMSLLMPALPGSGSDCLPHERCEEQGRLAKGSSKDAAS